MILYVSPHNTCQDILYYASVNGHVPLLAHNTVYKFNNIFPLLFSQGENIKSVIEDKLIDCTEVYGVSSFNELPLLVALVECTDRLGYLLLYNTEKVKLVSALRCSSVSLMNTLKSIMTTPDINASSRVYNPNWLKHTSITYDASIGTWIKKDVPANMIFKYDSKTGYILEDNIITECGLFKNNNTPSYKVLSKCAITDKIKNLVVLFSSKNLTCILDESKVNAIMTSDYIKELTIGMRVPLARYGLKGWLSDIYNEADAAVMLASNFKKGSNATFGDYAICTLRNKTWIKNTTAKKQQMARKVATTDGKYTVECRSLFSTIKNGGIGWQRSAQDKDNVYIIYDKNNNCIGGLNIRKSLMQKLVNMGESMRTKVERSQTKRNIMRYIYKVELTLDDNVTVQETIEQLVNEYSQSIQEVNNDGCYYSTFIDILAKALTFGGYKGSYAYDRIIELKYTSNLSDKMVLKYPDNLKSAGEISYEVKNGVMGPSNIDIIGAKIRVEDECIEFHSYNFDKIELTFVNKNNNELAKYNGYLKNGFTLFKNVNNIKDEFPARTFVFLHNDEYGSSRGKASVKNDIGCFDCCDAVFPTYYLHTIVSYDGNWYQIAASSGIYFANYALNYVGFVLSKASLGTISFDNLESNIFKHLFGRADVEFMNKTHEDKISRSDKYKSTYTDLVYDVTKATATGYLINNKASMCSNIKIGYIPDTPEEYEALLADTEKYDSIVSTSNIQYEDEEDDINLDDIDIDTSDLLDDEIIDDDLEGIEDVISDFDTDLYDTDTEQTTSSINDEDIDLDDMDLDTEDNWEAIRMAELAKNPKALSMIGNINGKETRVYWFDIMHALTADDTDIDNTNIQLLQTLWSSMASKMQVDEESLLRQMFDYIYVSDDSDESDGDSLDSNESTSVEDTTTSDDLDDLDDLGDDDDLLSMYQ